MIYRSKNRSGFTLIELLVVNCDNRNPSRHSLPDLHQGQREGVPDYLPEQREAVDAGMAHVS